MLPCNTPWCIWCIKLCMAYSHYAKGERNWSWMPAQPAELLSDSFPKPQAPVVQTMDSAIRRINHYSLDNSIGFASVYPLDSD